MLVKKLDKKGKVSSDKGLELSFIGKEFEPNMELVTQYVVMYLGNQRSASAKSKDRSEVRGGGKKPWKQKGTGRARVGSNRSPIWKGGGVTFGPTGEQNYKTKMTKSMKTKAFKSALAKLNEEESLLAIESPKFNKTSDVVKFVDGMGVRKVTFVHNSDNDLFKTARNVSNVKCVDVKELNTYDLSIAGKALFTEEAIKFLNERFN